MRRHAVLALLGVVALAVSGLWAPAAHACSCAMSDAQEAIVEANRLGEAVVIARRVDDGGGLQGQIEVLASVGRVQAEGRHPARFDDGASCDPMMAPGGIAALRLVKPEDGTSGWTTTGCGMYAIGDVLPLLPDVELVDDDAGPVVAVLGGSVGGGRLAALDAAGRIAAWGGEGGGSSQALAACPDGEHVVEVVLHDERLVLHRYDASGLAEVADPIVLDTGWGGAAGVTCHDPAAAAVTVLIPRYGEPATIARVSGATVEVSEAAAELAAAGAGLLVGVAGNVVVAVDPDGTSRELARIDETWALDRVAIAPDGAHIAVAGYTEDAGEAIAVIDVATGQTTSMLRPGYAGLAWLDATTLALIDLDGPIDAPVPPITLVDTSLAEVGTMPGMGRWMAVGLSGQLLGLGSALPTVATPDTTGTMTDIRLVGAQVAVALVDEPFRDLPADAPGDGDPPQADGGVQKPSTDTAGQALTIVAVVATVVAAVALGVLAARRRRTG